VVISSSREKFGYFGPFVAILFMGLNYSSIFFRCPFIFLDIRIQMVMPSLSALLSNPTWQSLSDVTPIFCAILFDINSKTVILFLAPRSFDHGRVENFLPSMETLNICPLVKEGGNPLPVPGAVLLHELCQLVIFFSVPISFCVLWILRNRELIYVLLRAHLDLGVQLQMTLFKVLREMCGISLFYQI
jgi:hypothetical protein